MPKASMDLTKFYFCKKYAQSYFIVFIENEPRMSQFAKDWDVFAVFANELVGNIV